MAIYPSGTIINNRYEVVQGPKEKPSLAGGMGLVYLCVDHADDGRPVALKTFRPELLSNRAARDRFLREGTTWVELGKHSHIVHCHSVFKADVGSEVFFALELVAAAEGKKDASLRSWLIPNEPMPLEQALLFALHICRGMVHATTKIPGMVHRDLKPENILIGRDGRARVTDFGLASAAQSIDSDWQMDGDKSSSHIRTQLTHGIAGTPLYMAPEQWKGEPLDERTDIYAFGCILYEMFCGASAITSNNVEEIKEVHCQGKLRDIPTELNESLSSLLRRCLTLNRADRYPDWIELEKGVEEVYHVISGERAPDIEEEVNDTRVDEIAVGWSYNAMGLSYKDIGKSAVARHYFEQVLSIARQHSDHVLARTALVNLGTAYTDLGDVRGAIEIFERCLTIAREIGDRHSEVQALGSLGAAYFQLGDARRTIEFSERCITIAREIGDRHDESAALGNLGIAYGQLGDTRRAIEFFEQLLAIAQEIGDRHDEGHTLGNLGIAYGQLGDYHRAIAFNEQHLKIACEIGDCNGEVNALYNLGIAYSQIGNLQQAINSYEKSLAIACEIGDKRKVALIRLNMALLYQNENPSKALDCANEACHLFTQMGHTPHAAQAKALINKIGG